jgi:hypothetical protein
MKVVELKKAMDARFDQVDVRFDRLEARMASEHDTTLRHMDMLFEQLKAEYRLGLAKLSL